MNTMTRPLHWVLLSACILTCSIACVDPQIKRGRDALGQGRYTEALVSLRAAHERKSEGLPDISSELASACRARAAELIGLGACGSAADLIAEADEYTPPILSDHRALYRCLEDYPTKPEETLKILKRLVDIGERHGPVVRSLVRILLQADDQESAMKYAPMALARFALEPSDTRRLGFIFASAGRDEEAMTYFWHFMQADASDPLVRLKVAELQERVGHTAAARKSLDALVRDFPNHTVVHLRLASFCKTHKDPVCTHAATDRANQLRGLKKEDRTLRPLPKSKR